MLGFTQKLLVPRLHLRVQRPKCIVSRRRVQIAAAEAELGEISPEALNAVNAAMARAVEADGAGDRSACEQALADAKRLLGSAGTQTDDVQR
jgi:hypothetical protein